MSRLGSLRSHRAFLVLLAGGVALRVLAQVAYWPAVEFPDTASYIQSAQHLTPGLWHPLGYSLFLRPFLPFHSVAAVTIAQHVLGLASGTLLYVMLRRLNVGAVLACVAAATFLLDPIQVALEQFVLSDVLFAFLVVAAIAVFVRRRLGVWLAFSGGLIVAAATTTRTIALVVVLPLAAYLLARRVSWRVFTAAGVALVVPLVAYAVAFHHVWGRYDLQGYSGRFLYGRVAPFATCGRDDIPPSQRPLCPVEPDAIRPSPSEYIWDGHLQYEALGLPHDELTHSNVAGTFARDVIVHQPLAYLNAVASDVVDAFKPGRNTTATQWFAGSWAFYLPNEPPYWRTKMMTTPFGTTAATQPHLNLGLARALHSYGNVVYTPGPLGALALLACVAAVLVGRSRRRPEMAMLTATGLLLVVVPIMTVTFDYRYALSGLQLIVAGGALATTILARRIGLRHRRWWRLRLVLVPAITAGLAVGNLAVVPVYADGQYLPHGRAHANQLVVAPSGRYVARIGPLRVLNLAHKSGHLVVRYRTCLTIEWRSGPPMLSSVENVRLLTPVWQTHIGLPSSPEPGWFEPMVLSAAHPVQSASVDIVYPHGPGGTIDVDYVDPLGGGSIGWTLPVTLSKVPPDAECATRTADS